jgi:hypothetical protein
MLFRSYSATANVSDEVAVVVVAAIAIVVALLINKPA